MRTRDDLDGGVLVTVEFGIGAPTGTIIWDAEQLLGSGELEVGDFTSGDVEKVVVGYPGKYRVQVGATPADNPSAVTVVYSLLRQLPASKRRAHSMPSAARVPGQPNPVWRGNSLPQITVTAVSAFLVLIVGIFLTTKSPVFGSALIVFALAALAAASVGFVKFRKRRR